MQYDKEAKKIVFNLKNTKIYRTDKDGTILFKIKKYDSLIKITKFCVLFKFLPKLFTSLYLFKSINIYLKVIFWKIVEN